MPSASSQGVALFNKKAFILIMGQQMDFSLFMAFIKVKIRLNSHFEGCCGFVAVFIMARRD